MSVIQKILTGVGGGRATNIHIGRHGNSEKHGLIGQQVSPLHTCRHQYE